MNVYERIAKSLTDEELNTFRDALLHEEKKRIDTYVRDRAYPPIFDHERDLVKDNRRIDAIKAYRERTGTTLLFAKAVIDTIR